jgi:hypothetical protein
MSRARPQVIGAVLELLSSAQRDAAWHGACLAVRRRPLRPFWGGRFD